MYTLRRSVHPPLLAACAAQRLRQGALLWLLCTRLPQTPGWLCANSSSRNTRRTWGSQKPHQSQPIQPQNQSCAAQVAASPCFFSAPFNPRDAAHHELLCFSVPTFSLDAGFHVLHPCFNSSHARKYSSECLFCRISGLRWLAFWLYNLYKSAAMKAVLTWQCALNSK